MRITKFGHSCIRIEQDGAVLVIDPGGWSEPEAVDGATAILITHEHADHYNLANLRASDAPIYTIATVAEQIERFGRDVLERVTVVGPNDSFDAGLPVQVVGERHVPIHNALPVPYNSGFYIVGERTVYHPGDAFTPPPGPVDVFCLPVSAPWLRMSRSLGFAESVGAPLTLAVHDASASADALAISDEHLSAAMAAMDGSAYTRVPAGTDV